MVAGRPAGRLQLAVRACDGGAGSRSSSLVAWLGRRSEPDVMGTRSALLGLVASPASTVLTMHGKELLGFEALECGSIR